MKVQKVQKNSIYLNKLFYNIINVLTLTFYKLNPC